MPSYPQAGVYRHHKGELYLVQGVAHDADYTGREVVVYVPLYTTPDHAGPVMAVRTLEYFTDSVPVEPYTGYCGDRSSCGGGNHACPGHTWTDARRFEYLGPVLTAEMITS